MLVDAGTTTELLVLASATARTFDVFALRATEQVVLPAPVNVVFAQESDFNSAPPFAVVAGEVRALAQRSATASKEIKELITDSLAHVDSGARQADRATQSMAEILASVRNVSGLMSEIAAASEEQSKGSEQVNSAVVQMDQVTQQNAALVEQASAAALSLTERAEQLESVVSVFRIRA